MGQGGRGLRSRKAEGEDEDDNGGGADDVKRQVDSDDKYQRPIYQLVNVKNGGGKLIDIIKSTACSSGSFNLSKSIEASSIQKQIDSAVDKQIHQLVEPLLYNNGRGKLIPLSTIWQARFGKSIPSSSNDQERANQSNTLDEGSTNGACDGSSVRYRWVCWKLEERGFVGETALHICFLLSTPTHMILAQKLLAMFPMLINDIYTCDEYFGESSLHMAIVNENVKIVKLLLDHGANEHERCLGSFFLPTDQKDKANGQIKRLFDRLRCRQKSRVDPGQQNKRRLSIQGEIDQIDLQSNEFNTLATNYDGYAYWGEYPLSFAACLGLTDCYKLLLAKGANPNRQDSNGNATLHMAVIADRMDMFDLCYANGANLNIVNKQNLTPLTLAAKLRRVDLFFHILTIQREISWIFCNFGFVEVPLNGVDSIDLENGSCNDDSVLSIVVFGSSNEHLQMLDGLLSQLLSIKWETAVRGKFYLWLGQFLTFLLIASVAYITRLYTFRVSTSSMAKTNETQQLAEIPLPNSSWQRWLSYESVNSYSEYALIIFVTYYLWVTIQRIVPSLGFKVLFKSLAQAPEMSMFTCTCFLILSCIPLRLLNLRPAEDFLAALIMFTLPLKLLFFCRASRSVGSFVVMIYKILVNDVLCFVVFLMIFVAGFSQSFLIIFKTHRPSLASNSTMETDKNYFVNLFDGVISMHMMALNEFTTVFDEFQETDYPQLAKILFCVYMLLVSILLINMLIAMLGKTYQDIASQPNESLRQWARALLIVERMWTKKERLQMLNRYSHARGRKATDGGCQRYYGSTWALTPKDREEISCLKRLNAENEKNRWRLMRTLKV